MMNEPVTIQIFSLNKDAIQAQSYLKQYGIDSFIFMEGNWTGGEGQAKTTQNIRLVARPVDAQKAIKLLNKRPSLGDDPEKVEGNSFFRRAGWMVAVLFVFYFVSSFRDGAIDKLELVPAAIFLVAAILFFVLAGMQSRSREAAPMV